MADDVKLHRGSVIPHLRDGDLALNWVPGPCGRLRNVPILATVASGGYPREVLDYLQGDPDPAAFHVKGRLPLASQAQLAIQGVTAFGDPEDQAYYPAYQACPFEWNSPDETVSIYKPGRLLRLAVAMVDHPWFIASFTQAIGPFDPPQPEPGTPLQEIRISILSHQCPGAKWRWVGLKRANPLEHPPMFAVRVVKEGTWTGITGIPNPSSVLLFMNPPALGGQLVAGVGEQAVYQQAPPDGSYGPIEVGPGVVGTLMGPYYFNG